jgi:hypothetical protein
VKQRLIDDAQHWRDRAEEVRTHAEQMNDADARMMMLGIARATKSSRNAPKSVSENRRIDPPGLPVAEQPTDRVSLIRYFS